MVNETEKHASPATTEANNIFDLKEMRLCMFRIWKMAERCKKTTCNERRFLSTFHSVLMY